jgi:hypothetical protein
MRKATRDFLNQRQPHSHAVVCICKVRPYRHKLQGDIVEAVGQEVLSDPEYRAVAGWRVHEWDGKSVRFEPWWWLAKPDAELGWTWWDVQNDGKDYDYIMDHDLCIARILELEQRMQVRPCDLVYQDGNWYLDGGDGLVWIKELSTKAILSESRPTKVMFDIAGGTGMMTITHGAQGISFGSSSFTMPQVTTSTVGTK